MRSRGREPWEFLTHVGIRLEGYVSQPLLLGIFHPDSPGHDGAVLLDEPGSFALPPIYRLRPTCPRSAASGERGTPAALGLSQQCDALVIAVSEEHGTIGIAEEGTFVGDVSASRLKEDLDDFWRRQYSTPREISEPWWKRSTVRVALVSIIRGPCQKCEQV